jgi:hypothetical protein
MEAAAVSELQGITRFKFHGGEVGLFMLYQSME